MALLRQAWCQSLDYVAPLSVKINHMSAVRVLKNIGLYIWQFPQSLLAGILCLFWRKRLGRAERYQGKIVLVFNRPYSFGMSLGQIIFVPPGNSSYTLAHEYGHSVQSLIFGPLYLVAVGIPSMVFCYLWDKWFHKNWIDSERIDWYRNRYPEKWADKLGGINTH
jgi:hypothetical protein